MKQTVVPFRNAIFLSIAAGFAESRGAEGLVIGAHGGDHAIYPDCREGFLKAMDAAMRRGTYAGIRLLRPFVARAGSIIAMDGRLWHTSGANITVDEDRALLFGYYTRSFLRPQVNWNAVLSAELQSELDPEFRHLLGLNASANITTGAQLIGADIGAVRGE